MESLALRKTANTDIDTIILSSIAVLDAKKGSQDTDGIRQEAAVLRRSIAKELMPEDLEKVIAEMEKVSSSMAVHRKTLDKIYKYFMDELEKCVKPDGGSRRRRRKTRTARRKMKRSTRRR